MTSPKSSKSPKIAATSKNTLRIPRPYLITIIFFAFFVVLMLAFIWASNTNEASKPATVVTPNNVAQSSNIATKTSTPAPLAALPIEENKRRAQAQFDEVSKTFCTYRDSTKYPNYSRPIEQHPDQVYPNHPVTESHPMRNHYGGADKSILLTTSQSRVYVAANEAIDISIKAQDQNGAQLPVQIESANARGLVFDNKPSPATQAVSFSSSNEGATQAMHFSPQQSNFARFDGTVRIDVNYSVSGKRGQVFFDFIYTPETPAVWSGKIRETNENGDLKFYLPVTIKTAGRYLASARLDDAKGKPIAYLSFNDILNQSDKEISLTMAGKLLRDAQVSFPVSLRDIEAYLLKENVDPDRALMPRLEGTQYQSRVYPLKAFSNEEWQSEERTRYLTEYSKDLQLARSALIATDASLAQQAKIQDPCNSR